MPQPLSFTFYSIWTQPSGSHIQKNIPGLRLIVPNRWLMPGPVTADQGGQAVTGPVGVNPWTLPPWPAQQWERGSKNASGQLDPSVSAASAEGPDWDLPSPRPASIHSAFGRHSLSVCRRCWPRGRTGSRCTAWPVSTARPPGRLAVSRPWAQAAGVGSGRVSASSCWCCPFAGAGPHRDTRLSASSPGWRELWSQQLVFIAPLPLPGCVTSGHPTRFSAVSPRL